MFSDELITQVREANGIEDVVSEAGLRLRGNKALCLFHKESKPSFQVYPKTNSFYCFGCGKGGDVIAFIMMTKGVSFVEAVRILADQKGIKLPELAEEDKQEVEKQKRREQILTETADFYHKQLLNALELSKRKEEVR